jgi:cyclic pyranopterin phosphate synthase
MRGINDHEAGALLRFCLDRGYQLRFIEQMPLHAQHGWRRADMVTAGEILTSLSAEFTLTPDGPQARDQRPPRPSGSTAARTARSTSLSVAEHHPT